MEEVSLTLSGARVEVGEPSPRCPVEEVGWAEDRLDLGPVGFGDGGGGHGDKPGPCCGVLSATQKVGALDARLEEEVQPSIWIHILFLIFNFLIKKIF